MAVAANIVADAAEHPIPFHSIPHPLHTVAPPVFPSSAAGLPVDLCGSSCILYYDRDAVAKHLHTERLSLQPGRCEYRSKNGDKHRSWSLWMLAPDWRRIKERLLISDNHRRQSSLKSGGVMDPGQQNFDFSRQIPEKFRFFSRQFHKKFDLSKQNFEKFRFFLRHFFEKFRFSQAIFWNPIFQAKIANLQLALGKLAYFSSNVTTFEHTSCTWQDIIFHDPSTTSHDPWDPTTRCQKSGGSRPPKFPGLTPLVIMGKDLQSSSIYVHGIYRLYTPWSRYMHRCKKTLTPKNKKR